MYEYKATYWENLTSIDSYSSRGTAGYGDRINHSIPHQRDSLGTSAETFSDKPPRVYSGKSAIESEEPWRPSDNNANLKVARKSERFDSRPVASAVWHQDHTNYVDDKLASTRILKDETLYLDRDHHSLRLKYPKEDLRAGNRGRDILQEDYKFGTSSQEPSQWSKQMNGPTVEMPSSLSEDVD